MTKYIFKRLIMCLAVVVCAAIIIFTIMFFVPGDPVKIMLGDSATIAQIEEKRHEMGLDDSYLVRLGSFLYNAFIKLDLGDSYSYSQPVMTELMHRFPRTLTIGALSILVDVVISIPLGIWAALNNGKWQDTCVLMFAMFTVSIPEFWFALILIVFFSLQLDWLPSFGVGGPQYFVMPVMANCLAGIGGLARQTRSGMLDVKKSDFVTTARSKGVAERSVVLKHMLPNALIPVVTVIGGHFGRCVAGTVIIEQIFSIPGVGTYMLQAVNARDYPVIQGGVIFLAITTSLIMLITDIVYAFIDPRIKAQYSGKAGR